MVQGTSSGAGKSLLAAALCRHYARLGLRVAPFKAQNMSNNARVVAEGEIGSAQYFQALAANVAPEVRMNPVLLKPEADTKSQVVLLGRPDLALSRLPWQERKDKLWPVVRQALNSLLSDYDLVIIEGAGSPAEINLKPGDIVNMRVALEARAPVLLVTDIDRGGAFAHLYGTWALLPAEERALIQGFVLNKFRGDQALLSPGPEMLRQLTGVRVVGTLPMLAHGLPEEDGVFSAKATGQGFTVAVAAYPRVSNLDEFEPLRHLAGVRLVWARSADQLADAGLVILPGSKQVANDLAWLRAEGLEAALRRHVELGKPVLGICGGLQMLGESLQDPYGVEGSGEGLGLLPYRTIYWPHKHQASTQTRFGGLEGFWQPLSGARVAGYQIRHGRTEPSAPLPEALPDGLGYQRGNVLAVYLHGLFENPVVVKALFGESSPGLEATFERLADWVEAHMDLKLLQSLAGGVAA